MNKIKKTHILSIGTELLLGDIVNTNASYLAQRLTEMGFLVYSQSVVGDNQERILMELERAFQNAEIVITTGGLGPTPDDLTKECAALYFQRKLIRDKESEEKIRNFFKKINKEMPIDNLKQADFPENSIILPNDYGTAPGCILEEENKILIILPGPPREMQKMFEDSVIPYLSQFQENIIFSKILRIAGLGESEMTEKVKSIIENSINPTVAPYAKDLECILRITAQAPNREKAETLIQPIEEKIRSILQENIYGINETSLEEATMQLLLSQKLTLSTAESCTGGLIAAKLIGFPGASQVFLEGMICYSNSSKIKRLGVSEQTIIKYGAVSEQTVAEMANNICAITGSDIGIAVSGIAGPSGATSEKPVGLVYIGLNIKGKIKVRKYNFWGDRNNIRNRASHTAIDWLRREILSTFA